MAEFMKWSLVAVVIIQVAYAVKSANEMNISYRITKSPVVKEVLLYRLNIVTSIITIMLSILWFMFK